MAGGGLLAAVVVWFLWLEIRKRGFDWEVFRHTVAALRWDWLLLSAVLALATYFGRALRWGVLMHPVKPGVGIWPLFTATAIGFTAITLLGRPGEFVRPYLIAVKERVPFSSQLAALLLERIYDLMMALLVFGYALASVQNSGVVVGPSLSWVLSVGGKFVVVASLICLVVLFLLRQFSQPMRRRLLDALGFLPERQFQRAERLVNAFVQGVESTRSRRGLLLVVSYTVLEWVLIAGCTFSIVRAFGDALPFSLTDVLIFMGFLSFGAVVQLPGVGGGVQVVAVLVLTELFGLPLEIAASVALLTWIITFIVIVPFGLIFALREGLNWRKLRGLGSEASA
jgi:uncharacterized protein (TIRG00374 family)